MAWGRSGGRVLAKRGVLAFRVSVYRRDLGSLGPGPRFTLGGARSVCVSCVFVCDLSACVLPVCLPACACACVSDACWCV